MISVVSVADPELFDEVLQSLLYLLQEQPQPLDHHQHWHFVFSSSLLLMVAESVIIILNDYKMIM